MGAEIALITPVHRNVPLSAQQPIRESGAALLIGGVSSDASSPAVMPMLRTMGFSPFAPGAMAPSQPPLVESGQASSAPASVVSLGDLAAALPPQQAVPHTPACHASSTGDAELTQLTPLRMVRMPHIGVPPPCVTLLAEAGVSAENLADLPWGVLENIACKVDGMGVAQSCVTLLRDVLHARLQADLEGRSGRSSKTESRSSSCVGSKSGSRSGGGKAESVLPHVPQSVAFGGLQQQAAGVHSAGRCR